MEPKLIVMDAEFARARWNNLYIMVWSGTVRADHLATIDKELSDLTRVHQSAITLSILEPGTKPPEPWARELIKKQQLVLAPRVVKSVQLVDGQGFWASSVIAVVVSFQNLRETGLRQFVARTVAEAATEILPSMRSAENKRITQAELVTAIRTARAQRNAHAA